MSRYEEVLDDVSSGLKELEDPDTGKKVIQKVFRREEVYSGAQVKNSADLIIHPNRGYDLKGSFKGSEIFEKGPRTGMHTYKDALVYYDEGVSCVEPNILDMFPTLIDLLKVEKPKGLDGMSLLKG